MEVVVEHDYCAEEPDELTIKKGDIIKEVEQFEEGWFIGTLNGKLGVFPDNFVKIFGERTQSDPHNVATIETVKEPTKHEINSNAAIEFGDHVTTNPKPSRPTGIGLGNIFSGKPIQLKQASLKDTLKESESNSDKTVNNGPGPDEAHPTSTSMDRVRVLYPYQPSQPDELELIVDDVVQVTNRKTCEEGWWQGKNLRTKQVGLFPDNFVTPIQNDEGKRPSENILNGARNNVQYHLPNGVTINSTNALGSSPSTTTTTTVFASPSTAEPPKVAVKPKSIVTHVSSVTSQGSSSHQDIPKGSALNATGRIGPGNDSVVMINPKNHNGMDHNGHAEYNQQHLPVEKLDQSESSILRKDENSRNASENGPHRLVGLTADRPKQTGRRLPSKFVGPAPYQETSPSSRQHQATKVFPTPPDEQISRTDTSEHSRSLASKRNTEPVEKNGRGTSKTTTSLNRMDAPVDMVRSVDTVGLSSTRSQQQPTAGVNNIIVHELKQQVKELTHKIDQLKETNSQLRSDMVHGQRLLTDRLHNLTGELDECRKQRAADAVELSRLRKMITQLDAKALNPFRDSKRYNGVNGGKQRNHSSVELEAQDANRNDQDGEEDQSSRMVGDTHDVSPSGKFHEWNPITKPQQSSAQHSYIRGSPVSKGYLSNYPRT